MLRSRNRVGISQNTSRLFDKMSCLNMNDEPEIAADYIVKPGLLDYHYMNDQRVKYET